MEEVSCPSVFHIVYLTYRKTKGFYFSNSCFLQREMGEEKISHRRRCHLEKRHAQFTFLQRLLTAVIESFRVFPHNMVNKEMSWPSIRKVKNNNNNNFQLSRKIMISIIPLSVSWKREYTDVDDSCSLGAY